MLDFGHFQQLLSFHKTVFIKEGAPMIIMSVFCRKLLVDYCNDNSSECWGKGTKVRQSLTKILEKEIAEFRGKIPAGVKEVTKCFSKKQIKGLKTLMN